MFAIRALNPKTNRYDLIRTTNAIPIVFSNQTLALSWALKRIKRRTPYKIIEKDFRGNTHEVVSMLQQHNWSF